MYTADVSSSQRWDQTNSPPQIVPLNYNNKKGPDTDFCHVAEKGAIVNRINSGVCGPNVTKIVYNVDKFILFDVLKSELRYCNPFQNGSTTN